MRNPRRGPRYMPVTRRKWSKIDSSTRKQSRQQVRVYIGKIETTEATPYNKNYQDCLRGGGSITRKISQGFILRDVPQNQSIFHLKRLRDVRSHSNRSVDGFFLGPSSASATMKKEKKRKPEKKGKPTLAIAVACETNDCVGNQEDLVHWLPYVSKKNSCDG